MRAREKLKNGVGTVGLLAGVGKLVSGKASGRRRENVGTVGFFVPQGLHHLRRYRNNLAKLEGCVNDSTFHA
jgi:hypothetical protein